MFCTTGLSRWSESALLLLLLAVVLCTGGCGSEPPPGPVVQQEFVLPEVLVPSSFTAPEQQEFHFRPSFRAPDGSTVGSSPVKLEFKAAAPLPEGAVLDPHSGEIRWTPTELQGPVTKRVKLQYSSVQPEKKEGTFEFDIVVTEENSPPVLHVPGQVDGAAGHLLEVDLEVSDADFPSNQLKAEIQAADTTGMSIDLTSRKFRWEVPANWKQAQTVVTLVISDNGQQPHSVKRTVRLQIEPAKEAGPVQPVRQPAQSKRRPDIYVALPDLPRKAEEVGAAAVRLKGFTPPVSPGEKPLTLSLVMPDDLNQKLNVSYPQDGRGSLHIRSTEPFDAEGGASGQVLPPLVLAGCYLEGDSLVWTWALTKDSDVRGLQNNLRQCVLSVDAASGKSLWLAALQPVQSVEAPTVGSLLNDRDLRSRLYRRDSVSVLTPLDESEFSLKVEFGRSQTCQTVVDGNTLEVTASGLSAAPGIQQLKFSILSLSGEVAVRLGTEPSIEAVSKAASASANILSGTRNSARQASRKLARANASYNGASRMTVRNRGDQIVKDGQMRRAAAEQAKWFARLQEHQSKLPTLEEAAGISARELQELRSRLEPLKELRLTGELRRTIGDIELTVARLQMPSEL